MIMRKKITRILTVALLTGAVAGTVVAAIEGSKAAQFKDAADAITPPYVANFTSDAFTVLNVNNDTKEWLFSDDHEAYIDYNGSMAMDDWLITPALYLEKDKMYDVSFQSKAGMSSYSETLEVKYGRDNTEQAMLEGVTLMEPTSFNKTDYTDFTYTIICNETGLYYIGFHGCSAINMFKLYLANVQVSKGVTTTSPGAVTDLTATPDPNGVLECTVSFTTPVVTIGGNNLKEITKAEIYRGDELIHTIQSPATGAQLSYVDHPTTGGTLEYSVVCHNLDGEGLTATVSAFVGFDKPKTIENVVMTPSETEGYAVISWDAVTEDINGLTLTSSDVSYSIYEIDYIDYYGNVTLGEEVAGDLTGTTHTMKVSEPGEQNFYRYALVPETTGGQGQPTLTENTPIGTPLTEYAESFSGREVNNVTYIESVDRCDFSIISSNYSSGPSKAYDDDEGFIKMDEYTAGRAGNIITGWIDLSDFVNPTLFFYTYNVEQYGSPNENLISVSIKPFGASEWISILEPKAVKDFFDGALDLWGKVAAGVPAQYADKVVQFKINVTRAGGCNVAYLDNIYLDSVHDFDLTITNITSKADVDAGKDYEVNVTVLNKGANTAESYQVELYADGNLIDTKELSNLERETVNNVVFNCTMDVLAMEPVAHYAKVILEGDGDNANDISETITVTPRISSLPVATEVYGEDSNGVNIINWTAPDLANMVTEQLTEDFESGIHAADTFGEWNFVDGDGATWGYINVLEGITRFETKGAFWVMDYNAELWSNSNDRYSAHSGTKMLVSVKPASGDPDEWAISPELSGDAQTISFWARCACDYEGFSYYQPAFRVYYSTGSIDTEEFVEIPSAYVANVPNSWTQYSVELPEGAAYFAIRVVEKNMHNLVMFDDVTYTPVNPSTFEILGYNIYRDGVRINEEPVTDTTYTDSDVDRASSYKYAVTVVYKDRGESAPVFADVVTGMGSIAGGNATVTVVGGDIVIANADGLQVTVASVNGSVIFSGLGETKTIVPASSGIYIVKVGNAVRKVMVR